MSKMSKGNGFSRWLAPLFVAALVLLMGACSVEQTQEAELPDVDVDVDAEAGKLPAFDVDWADIDVGTRTKMVKVPKVVVVMEEVEVEVPYFDFDMPNAGEREQRTIVVEAEVEKEMYELSINEVYAKGETLMVISTLESTGQPLADHERVRVSDRIMLNAPDLDVRHYIVGEKPDGDWNSQYRFFADRGALDSRLKGAHRIYTR